MMDPAPPAATSPGPPPSESSVGTAVDYKVNMLTVLGIVHPIIL